MKFKAVQLQNERDTTTEKNCHRQSEKHRQTDRGQERHRETDPSYSCPAGERIGGIGEARQGPAIGSMLAVCV